jgi:hypothetical protein
MRVVLGVLAVLAALALAACGSTKTVTTTVTSGQAATTTGGSGSTSATTTSASTVASTTSGGGVPHCRAGMFALSYLGQQGATGHGEIGFALKNISASSCRTFGFPGVLFLNQSGAPLPTISTRTTHDFFGVTPLQALLVAPGASVSFRLGVTHGISSPAGCTTAYGLQVIPPNDTGLLRTTIPQGAYECQTTTVSPLQADNSAYAAG